MRDIANYIKILDSAFPKPPKNVPELILEDMRTAPCEFIIHKYAGCMVFILGCNTYMIANMAVCKNKQYKGFGRKIMEEIHNKFKGTFILKTRHAGGFYAKLGYKAIRIEKGNQYVMAYCNDGSGIL